MKKKIKILLALSGLIVTYIVILLCVKIFYIMGPSAAEKVDFTQSNNEVLLVIDIQNRYLKMLSQNQADKYIFNINKIIDHTQKLKNEVIFFVAVRKNNLISSIFLPDITIQGSESAKIDTRLMIKNPVIFEKFKADGFYNNNFKAYLESNKVKKIYITGVAAEVCVGETIKGALNKGYKVTVIKDAVISIFGKKSLTKKMVEFKKLGANVISVNDYLNLKK